MKVAVFGATGLVGRTMLAQLESRSWVESEPVALASSRSAGLRLPFRGGEIICREVSDGAFAGVDVALFSAGGRRSLDRAPAAVAQGAVVIDNSSAWRMDPEVPLVVPEINGDLLGPGPGIIANPNCSTIQIAMALAPLHEAFGLKGAHVTTLQSVSGAGESGRKTLADELRSAGAAIGDGGAPAIPAAGAGPFPRAIAFNAVPEIGVALPDGSFEEEDKVVRELRKILRLPDLAVTCLATRVPSWNGHGAAVRAVFDRPADLREAAAALREFPGVETADGPHGYLTPAEISGSGAVHVGRLRAEPGRPDVLLMWVVADNLLKGAALNAVQIADRIAGAASGGGVS